MTDTTDPPPFTGTGDPPPDWTPAAAAGALPSWLATFPAAVPASVAGDPSGRVKYLVGYDIRESSRLQRLHKRLKDFGQPVQYSVFECLLFPSELERLWTMVCATIDQEVDWVVLYRLHKPFDEAVRHVGFYRPELLDEDDIVFI